MYMYVYVHVYMYHVYTCTCTSSGILHSGPSEIPMSCVRDSVLLDPSQDSLRMHLRLIPDELMWPNHFTYIYLAVGVKYFLLSIVTLGSEPSISGPDPSRTLHYSLQ